MDPCTSPSQQITRCPPGTPTREGRPGLRSLDTSPVARPDAVHRPRRIFTDDGTAAAQLDPCTPPYQQMTTSPPGSPTRGGPQLDPCPPPAQQMTRCPPGSPIRGGLQRQQQDPCTPPSQQMTCSPPGSPGRGSLQLQQQDPCPPPAQQMTRCPPGSPARGSLQLQQQDPCTPPSQQMTWSPPGSPARGGLQLQQQDPCTPPSHQMTRCSPGSPTRGGPQQDPCTPTSHQMTRCSPGSATRGGPQQDPCTPPSQQMTCSPPGSPGRGGLQLQQQDPCPPPAQQMTRCPPGSPIRGSLQLQQQDPCTPPSQQMTCSTPGSPARGGLQLQQQDPCSQPSQQMTCSPPGSPARGGLQLQQQDPCTPPSQQMNRCPPSRSTRECQTSPHSIGGRSYPQSEPSLPSSPGSDLYWPTSEEEGFQSRGTSVFSSNWSDGTGSSPPLSSLESGISTPVMTPPDMSPAPEMLPSAFYATDTNVVKPNFETILLIIDYLANTFCEDRRQRLDQINCFVTQLTSLQGNELQDSLLTLRDLIIRRGRMLPDLYDYFRALSEELKEIHKKATDRHKPVPNLYKLCELACEKLDPMLSQETYLKIINDLRLFADWAYLRCSHDKHTNDELQNEIEDLMCCPENLEDFTHHFCDLFEEGSRSIDIILEKLNRSQLKIDAFLEHWKKGGEILNQPVPNDMVRICIQLPNLDIPELEAGVEPGGPVAGTGINAEPLGPPPPPPGYQPILQMPIAPPSLGPPRPTRTESAKPCPTQDEPSRAAACQPPPQPYPTRAAACQPPPQPCPTRDAACQLPPQPCPTRVGPSGTAAAWDAPGPSGLQSGRFANAPIPGPGARSAYSSSSDSSPCCPGHQLDKERDFC